MRTLGTREFVGLFGNKKSFAACLSSDDEAQIHVLETVIGGLFLLAALIAAINAAPNTSQSDSGVNQLDILGEDALRALANLPPENANSTRYQDSTLTYYCVTGQTWNLSSYFNMSFKNTVSYSFKLYNHTGPGDKLLVFSYATSAHIMSDSAACYRIITYKEAIYDFQLVLWLEPREVSH